MTTDLRKSQFLVVTRHKDGSTTLRGPFLTARGAKTSGFTARRKCQWQAIIEADGAVCHAVYAMSGTCDVSQIPTWRTK